MRKDIFLAVPAAGLLFFGAAALFAVLTQPDLAHWYLAFWVGVICTPLGAANVIMLLIWEMIDPVLRDRRRKVLPVLLVNFGICAIIGGLVLYFSESKIPSEIKTTDHPTLLSMFVRDLQTNPGFIIYGCTEYDQPDLKDRIYYKIVGNVSANSKFLVFYIPSSKYLFRIIESIATEHADWISQVENTIHFNNEVQGNTSPVLSQNMVFSNVIYIYHEDTLDAVQIGNLTKTFNEKNLVLQIRSHSYLMGAWDAIKAGRIAKIPEYQTTGCRVVPVKNN